MRVRWTRVFGAATAVATATATVAAAVVGSVAVLLLVLLLLCEHGLLRGDLVEQGAEALTRVGGGNGTALGLELCLTLFLGKALALGTLALGSGLASGLLGGLGGSRHAALLLAASLGGKALLLGACALLGLLLGGLLGLGLLLGLDLGGTGLDHGRELLAHHRDVSVLERGARGFNGDLQLGKMAHKLFGRHTELFGKGGNTSLRHLPNHLPFGRRAPRELT